MGEYGFGALPSPVDVRDYKLNIAAMTPQSLPKTFQLIPTTIKNQGSQPTCVAHALSSLVEFYNLRDTERKEVFSTEFIYGCRADDEYQGNGMYLRDGLKVLQKYGDVWNVRLSGNSDVATAMKRVKANFDTLCVLAKPNRITSYFKIQTLNELKQALENCGRVPATMKWFSGAKVGSDGLYKYGQTDIKDYHAVLIIGWDENNLIVQNSWGSLWGKHGLFYVPINKIEEVFCEFYGVTDNINDVVKPSPTVNQFSPLINCILRLINIIREVLR